MNTKILTALIIAALYAASPIFTQSVSQLSNQGDSLYYLKEYDKSILKYEEALSIDPAAVDIIYNAACVYSLLGRTDDAFAKLELLPPLSYDNLKWISGDTDLESLRQDERWNKLITAVKHNLDKRKDIGYMKIVTSDIDNFWAMYDLYKTSRSIADIQSLYFDKRSAGLDAFTKRRVINAREMDTAIKMYPRYLESIRGNTLKISGLKEKLKGYFLKLQKIYPDVYFPDIYFAMGCFNTGGTVSGRMLLKW